MFDHIPADMSEEELDEFLDAVSRRVKVACAARGWTLGDLAAAADLRRDKLSRTLKGHTGWNIDDPKGTLHQIASALEVDPAALLPPDGKPKASHLISLLGPVANPA